MTENNTFDLTDWLAGGTEHRYTATATIYLDPSLPAEIAKWQAQQSATADTLGGGGATEMDAELLARLQKGKAEVAVFGLIASELEEAKAALGDKPAGYNYANDPAFTYQILERAARFQPHGAEPIKLTAEQWGKLHETLGAQFNEINTAYAKALAGKAQVDARFRS